jgi:threonine aldolase
VPDIIDLRSDTITQPTQAMRRAMADAEVGDDFYHEDPTVKALEEVSADLTGKEAGLLVASGTMGNLVSLLSQARHGEALIVGASSHIYLNEAGNLAAVGGLLPRLFEDRNGRIAPEALLAARQGDGVLYARATLAAIENTHNNGGGRCLSPALVSLLADAAHQAGLRIHCDGARLFNAAVALRVRPAELAAPVDSLTFCLSKGLAGPFGSLVVGDKPFIEEARHWRQRIGGGFRQIGIAAAAGLVALRDMVSRLEDDHLNARALAEGLAAIGWPVDPSGVETNMVFVEVPPELGDPVRFVERLAEQRVRANRPRGRRVRFVTHLGVDARDIAEAVRRIARISAELRDNAVVTSAGSGR